MAQTDLKGICLGCGAEVVPKCGTQRVHHWAHARNRNCDSWAEPETEWHRNWKNEFPVEWQETFLPDKITGEKHIADVLTTDNLIIEFQHSHIDPLERLKREAFYKNMIWIVDGLRLIRTYPRFLKAKRNFRLLKPGLYEVQHTELGLPVEWLNSSVPVIFDFLDGTAGENVISSKEVYLYCLFPVRPYGVTTIALFTRNSLVKNIISGEWSVRANSFLDSLRQKANEEKELRQKIQRLEDRHAFMKLSGMVGRTRRRKF